MSDPETFLKKLKEHFKFNPEIKILVSTGNVLFFINRILYFFGFFNYSKRGILDITHKRLFTRSSFLKLFKGEGFEDIKIIDIPGPWSLIFGDNYFSTIIIKINDLLCKVFPGIFAYQFFLEIKQTPHLDYLLKTTNKIK